ncbi:MAG: GntR family transcriptional regulator [Clostridiales bacterium]|nr:GntR family transcriptional regulator [Clostridiales bacterium]
MGTSKNVNPDSMTPMYKQIIDILGRKIEEGELRPGDRIPSEAELMQAYHGSRISVRSAINELEEDGMVVRSRGKGTFVASRKALYSVDDQIGFTHSCFQEGKVPRTEVLSVSWIYPTRADVEFFGIDEDETILCTRRLRYVDDVPTMIEVNHYNRMFGFLEREDLSQSLFEILQKHKIRLGGHIRILEVCYANSSDAGILGVKPGAALLLFTDKHEDSGGSPLYISRQMYCTERLKFYV